MWAGFTSGGYFVTFSSRPAGTLEFLRVFFSSHLPGIIGLRFFNGDMKDWFVTDQICWGTPGTLPGHSRDTPGTLPGHSQDRRVAVPSKFRRGALSNDGMSLSREAA